MNSLLLPLLSLSSCAVAPEGLRVTPDGDGPLVMIDWDAEPLPEIPYPNDLAARADPTSPTGLRINISEEAPTELERSARRKINELSGFGIYSPISIRFEAPLDLDNIAARHVDDFDLSDDAVYLINVDPDSEGFGEFAELDVGHGRYPADVDETDRYFPNDPRMTSPSLIFELGDEDINGNGQLDPGEDSDNDGILDYPNVYPDLPDEDRCKGLALLHDFDETSCPERRHQLLTWYERETDTLLVRPVVPLREETTYAVVVTERLVGEDGAPVRSPWEYVNHTRQTDALLPAVDSLAEVGLTVDDVAFAWSFTTARITGDLVDIHRGLVDGEGPWPFLKDDCPAGVFEALPLHEISSLDDPYILPVTTFTTLAGSLDLLGSAGDYVIIPTYEEFADALVGGAFETPYFLADRDDGGYDDSDEWWQVDPVAGTASFKGQRLAFTCVLPKEDGEIKQPFDVALFGHGYGSSRFDMLGFGFAFSHIGMALCAVDSPGHGPTISPDDLEEYLPIIDGFGLTPFLEHLEDSRYRDLTNDGVPDSGADQWTSDAFHTRDMVRQQVVDWMQMVRAFKNCGQGEMTKGDEVVVSCDWDGDGTPDIGGPDATYHMLGGSLGGINSAVAAGVMPEIQSFSPVVAGGGLMDIGMRSPLGGVVEALVGRLESPLILGIPDGAGGLSIQQMVISEVDEVFLPVAHIASIPAGGRVVVENLANGEVREGIIPDGSQAYDASDPNDPYAAGRFRVGIPADALRGPEKRGVVGMPLEGPEAGDIYPSPDNTLLGDPLVITIYDADGAEVAAIDSWETEVVFEGVSMAAGSPLVAGSDGLGHTRGSSNLRRLLGVTAQITEPGDPIAYAPHYVDDPFEVLGGEPANVLLMPTPGDTIVSVNTEVALARAANFIERHEVDDRYGVPVDRWLIDHWVVHGLEQFGPYTDPETGAPVLFDVEDYDEGTDGLGAPSDDPLRSWKETDRGMVGLTMPYISPTGSHGFSFPDPDAEFDINTFSIYQIARYFQTGGEEITADLCLEDVSCDYFRQAVGQ
jgi:hypothetical protein